MAASPNIVKLKAKIDESSRNHRQNVVKVEADELLETAVELCEKHGLADAIEYIDGMFEAFAEAEIWCRQLTLKQRDDNIRDLGIRIDALDCGKEAAKVASTKVFPTSAAIDAQTSANRPTLRDKVREEKLVDECLAFNALYQNLPISLQDFGHLYGPKQRLTAEQLSDMNTKMAGHKVITWRLVNLTVNNPVLRSLMPCAVTNLDLELGPEIVRDWLVPRAGHGFPVATIAASWNTVRRHPELVPAEPSTNGNLAFQLNKKRLVTNNARNVVITYFDTDYGA